MENFSRIFKNKVVKITALQTKTQAPTPRLCLSHSFF